MRRCGPAKQRVWLGPGGYLSGGGRRFTNTHTNPNAHSYADSDTYGNSHSNADANSHTAIWHPNAAASQGNTKAPADSAFAALRIG